MAGAQTGMAGAEVALQEFIDALQALILLLPPGEGEEPMWVNSTAEHLGAAGSAARRTMTTARRLHARLVALRQNPSAARIPLAD